MDIHLTKLNREMWKETPYSTEQQPKPPQYVAENTSPTRERRYNPISSLLPKFWLPTWGIDEDGYQLGLLTGGRDVLGHHTYYLSALYGLESERMGFFGQYINQQFYPTVTLFGSDTANVFVDIFQEGEEDEDYWQWEQVAGIDISFPLYRSKETEFAFSTGYRFKKMKHLTDPDTLTPTPDEGELSGLSAGIHFHNLESSIYGISPESGFLSSLTYRRDDEALGSDYNLNTFVGDSRVYLKIPKLRHHVLALRTVGGLSDGDTLTQGIFQLGGYEIDGGIAFPDQQRFFLRGYDNRALSGNRFALGSAEYRFPLWYPQRGLGTGWLFFDSLAGAVFYDVGNAWDGDTELSEFKQGVGAELRLNLGLKHGMLPLTVRLGYAYGLDDDIGESQFIGTFTFGFWL
jgi:outer membrane protein assembly factor BamA